MFLLFSTFKNYSSRLIGLFAIFWLAACEPIALGGGSSGPSINTNAPVPVALLVPGGSSNAGDSLIAKNLENAARLAIADLQGVQIDLRVYNTAGNPTQAAQVAVQAVNDGAKIILGPLHSAAANAVGVAVSGSNVNVLAFSNNTEIAGGNVFVLGNTFGNTANRLVGYAKGQGRNRVMIVHAQSRAGEIGRDAITRAISRNGVTSAGIGSYEFSQNGVTQAATSIASTASSSGADAIFFTSDTAGALPFLAQLLPEKGVNPANVKFLGLTRWDIPQATLALPGLQGAWFARPDQQMTRNFEARYNSAYGEAAHPLAGIAYDGIAAIGALVKSGNANALTTGALTQSSGFAGVNGVFRLLPDGTNQRALEVVQIQNNQAVVIDPAPRGFGGGS